MGNAGSLERKKGVGEAEAALGEAAVGRVKRRFDYLAAGASITGGPRRSDEDLDSSDNTKVISHDTFTSLVGTELKDCSCGAALCNRLFSALDTNGDGCLTYEEFVLGVYLLRKAPEQDRISTLLNMYAGATMVMNIATLKDVLLDSLMADIPPTTKSLPQPPAALLDALVDSAIVRFDSDGDGRLNEKEWTMLVAAEPALSAMLNLLQRGGKVLCPVDLS